MDPLGLAAAGVSLGGDALSAWLGHEEAQNAQAFAERMASTQYQRTVADLKAAGLNPMLAYMNTNAAPSSAVASVPHIGSGAASSFSSVHSAKAAARLADEQAKIPEAQLQQMAEQTQLLRDQAALAATQQQHEVTKELVSRYQARLTHAEARSAEAEASFNEMLHGAAKSLGPGALLGSTVLQSLLRRGK